MVDVTEGTLAERRRKNKERMEMIRRGDLKQAMDSISSLSCVYADMTNELKRALNNFSDTVKIEREKFVAAESLFKRFNGNVEALMGDSIRCLLAECDNVIKEDEVTEIADDTKFSNLLQRIGKADLMNGLKMSKRGYDIAVKTIGSYTSKLIGLKRKTMLSGSSRAEVSTAETLIQKMEYILETLKHRKDILVEQNISIKREIIKFADTNTVSKNSDRDLNDKERDNLKGLI